MSNNAYLKTLVLARFGRWRDLTVEFAPTLTVFKGPNGFGKTTILKGIYFALFGISALDDSSDDIVMTGEKDCKVTLIMDIGAEKYQITRTLKTAEIVQFESIFSEPPLIATGHTSVNAWIVDKLGVSAKQFIELTYSQQTETAALLTLGASKLNQMIEKIAQADYIDQVQEVSNNFAACAKVALQYIPVFRDPPEVQKEIDDKQLSQLNLGLPALKEDSAVARLAAEEAEKALENGREAHQKASDFKVALDAHKSMFERHSNTVALLNKQLETLGEYVEPGDLEAEFAVLTKQADAAEISVKVDEYNKNIVESVNRWLEDTGKPQLALFEKLSPELEKALKLCKKHSDATIAARTTYENYKDDLKKAKKALDASVCSECARPYDEAELAKAKTRYDKLKIEVDASEIGLSELEGVLSAAETAVKKLKKECPSDSIINEVAERQSAVAVALKSINGKFTREDVNALHSKKGQLSDRFEVIERNNEYILRTKKDRDATAALVTKAAEACNEFLDKLKATPAVDLGMLQIVAKSQKEASEVAQEKYRKGASASEILDREIAQLRKEFKVATELAEKKDEYEKDVHRFNGLTKYLRDNRAIFMDDLWSQIMAITSEFVSGVTEGRIESLERDPGGEFYYIEDGNRRAVVTLSGGLKAIAGVGLRIALASLLPAGVSFAVLDEPSSELRDDMAAALAGALRGTDRQIVLVTHREGEEYAADTTIDVAMLTN